ncbi:hypothetical protein L484_000588 [Morus notabilis]|uniref:Uncharacterized protein n=1 Tax=Morus notabilis TaxID=981085 RepID=W9SNT6_9ROSA|nr:hypothetical protein L484_000588 [Morus notabilis]
MQVYSVAFTSESSLRYPPFIQHDYLPRSCCSCNVCFRRLAEKSKSSTYIVLSQHIARPNVNMVPAYTVLCSDPLNKSQGSYLCKS